MNNQEALALGEVILHAMVGRVLDVLAVSKPLDLRSAIVLAKMLSKLSPIVGNTIESIIAQDLNSHSELWPEGCEWVRQDPDFPDVVLAGMAEPRPGFEVKAWMPMATEITGRFRDSQSSLVSHEAKVAVICWLPEYLIAGRPKVLGVFTCPAIEVAIARDTKYHQPPHYVLREPEDTSGRTRNLQQKNTNAFIFQGSPAEQEEAEALVASWGPDGRRYRPDKAYQATIRDLMARFPYRAETNFAKLDRIDLLSLETFKSMMYASTFIDHTVEEWRAYLKRSDLTALAQFVTGPISAAELEGEALHVELEEDNT